MPPASSHCSPGTLGAHSHSSCHSTAPAPAVRRLPSLLPASSAPAHLVPGAMLSNYSDALHWQGMAGHWMVAAQGPCPARARGPQPHPLGARGWPGHPGCSWGSHCTPVVWVGCEAIPDCFLSEKSLGKRAATHKSY